MLKIMYGHLFIIVVICFGASNSTFTSTSAGSVEYLPGFKGKLPFKMETGYVGVDENEDVQLFYYFIQSESNPEHDPLMLCMSGGPGCSSISGLLYEIGPIQFKTVKYNGSLTSLILTPNSWTKTSSIAFLDIPVGTGFSYARSTLVSNSTDVGWSDQAYEFMTKWLDRQEFHSNPFYVGGDSYAGNPVPIIAQLISDGNEAGNEAYTNLKGYVLGNPMTSPDESNYKIRFANDMALISDELYKSLFDACHGEYRSDHISPSNLQYCLRNLELYQECIDGIENSHVLEPYCGSLVSPIERVGERSYEESHLLSTFYCRVTLQGRRSLAATFVAAISSGFRRYKY